MKILLGIVTVLLVAVASGSGIFINSLSGRIDDLEKELVSSIDNVGSVVDGEVNRLDVELQTVNAAIEDTNADMSDYAVATGNSFARIEGDIEANSTQISGISGKLTETEDVVNKSVLQTSELYEKLKNSVARIICHKITQVVYGCFCDYK